MLIHVHVNLCLATCHRRMNKDMLAQGLGLHGHSIMNEKAPDYASSLLNTRAYSPLTQVVQTCAKEPLLPACAREPELRLESSSFPAGIQLPSGRSRWDE